MKAVMNFSALLLIGTCPLLWAQTTTTKTSMPLTSTQGLQLVNVSAEAGVHQGKKGLRVARNSAEIVANRETLVIIPQVEFGDGTIEVELAGEPAADANDQARGFVGLAFRVQQQDTLRYECFYVRPSNGRAEEQLRRNHSTQYVSHPEFPWYRLRQESPGVYESYVDLAGGAWTKLKITVAGQQAKLYVHDSAQPCLIVNDLKHGMSQGSVALWLAPSTVAHFRNLVITPAPAARNN